MKYKQINDAEFKIKFDGDLYEVDANTLISSLLGISTAIQEINTELSPDKKIEIKIKAPERGSFSVYLHLIQGTLETLLKYITHENIITASAIVVMFAEILNIKKHLAGEKPKKIDQKEKSIYLENSKGNTLIIDSRTYKIYQQNKNIDSALSKSFETISKDESITDFKLIGEENESLFEATYDDFEFMSAPSPISETEETKIKTEEVELKIFKLVFQESYKWEFYCRGFKISAKIKDADFNKKIDSGESFSKGDALLVELNTHQVFDKSVNEFINKSYEITKVLKHTPRPHQQNLF